MALPLIYIRIGVAVSLAGLGVYKLIRSRHFHWGGMQVGFRELTIWSFLMASAHGAGLMVLPVGRRDRMRITTLGSRRPGSISSMWWCQAVYRPAS